MKFIKFLVILIIIYFVVVGILYFFNVCKKTINFIPQAFIPGVTDKRKIDWGLEFYRLKLCPLTEELW